MITPIPKMRSMNRSTRKDWVARAETWDRKWIQRLNGQPDKFLTKFFHIFSFFGRETPWLFLTEFFLFIYYIPTIYAHLGLNMIYGIGIVYVLKRLTMRPRPWIDLPNLRVLDGPNSSHSFPSWHTYQIVAFSCSLGYLTNSYWVLAVGLIASAVLAYSRIYLGVHYPTDVIAGYLAGFAGFALSLWTTPFFVTMLGFFETLFPYPPTYGLNYMFHFWWYYPIIGAAYTFIVFTALYRRFNRKDLANWDTTKAKIVYTPPENKLPLKIS